MSQRVVGAVAIGDELAAETRNASRAQLFLYSAATHNPHRIHYDRDYALTEGHVDIIVHGPLQGAWLSHAPCNGPCTITSGWPSSTA